MWVTYHPDICALEVLDSNFNQVSTFNEIITPNFTYSQTYIVMIKYDWKLVDQNYCFFTINPMTGT